MADPTSIPDATDWLATPLSGFSPVETALRCQVCKDFYDTPMITKCSHTFCSLCIRRCLALDGKCPACRATEQEINLRRNDTLSTLVEAFQAVREGILKFAKEASVRPQETQQGSKRKLDQTSSEFTADEGTQSHSRKTRSQSRKAGSINGHDGPVVISDNEDEDSAKSIEDVGSVPCPICQKYMKPEAVYSHLDTCGMEESEPSFGQVKSSLSPPRPSQRFDFGRPIQSSQGRLPRLNFSIMKDQALRKKLSELGIPNDGSRALMEKRHTEWVNLVNANCDSKIPRPTRELLSQLQLWERSQSNTTTFRPKTGEDVMQKDFDHQGWSSKHNTDFQQLIANARAKRQNMSKDENKDETLQAGSSLNGHPMPKFDSVEETTQITALQDMEPPISLEPS